MANDKVIKDVSDYKGTEADEIITLKEGSVNEEEDVLKGNTYVSNANGTKVTVEAFALGNDGNDTIYGTKNNDWINGGKGDDKIYGGEGGYDMLSGGQDDDLIAAGAVVTQKEATGADDGTTLKNGYTKLTNGEFIKLNTTGSEIYGDAGNDIIYSGSGDDFIWAAGGNDTIYLNGGKNTLLYSNLAYDENGFGTDTIYNATSNDTLEFYLQGSTKYLGYKLSDLTITGTAPTGANQKSDLTINASDDNSITLKDFFVTDKDGKLIENTINLNVLSENAEKNTNGINASADVASVKYSTDGKIYVDDVSDYVGIKGLSEIVTLKKADKVVDGIENDYLTGSTSKISGKTYQFFAKANLSEGTLQDKVTGSASNDLIIGSNSGDILLGGTAGQDVIIGGDGADYIIAGSETTEKSADKTIKISGNDLNVKFNSTGSELYGRDGNDFIYSSKGNDYISGGKGDDNIYLNGGANTLLFTDTSFGHDTIDNATVKDTLKFFDGKNGFKLEDLKFIKSEDNLNIVKDDNSNYVTIKDFFKSAKVDSFVAANSKNIETTYSILKDAVIDMGSVTKSYTGSTYNENVTAGAKDLEFTLGATNNTVNYTVGKIGKSVINLTKGENLNLLFDSGDLSGLTYTVNDEKDLILQVSNETITIKSYMTGKTGANVQISGKDMYEWKTISTGLSGLSSATNYNAIEAMDKNGKLSGSELSDMFDVSNYVSDTNKGVTITSNGGDDIVVGSNYNDKVTFKSGNNEITETEGTNNVKTGAGNDKFTANEGTSSNTVNLGDGNNEVTLKNIGTNKITTGKGNDSVTVQNGTNTVKSGAGNNIVDLQGGINTVTTGKGNDYYTLSNGENIVKSGSGSDTFNITGGVNKIITSGAKTNVATINITAASYNNIKSGSSADNYTINVGNNTIDSGAGNDKFSIAGGSNNIKAGAGDDKLDITTDSTNIIDMGAGIDNVTIAAGKNNVKLGAGDDSIKVTAASTNIIDSGAGIDIIELQNGANTVNAGAGNDNITISGGTNIVSGGAGNDTFTIKGGANTINGGAGKDTYDLSNFDFTSDMVISDTSGISTLKLANATAKLDGNASSDGKTYSLFANVTLVSPKIAKSGYISDGFILTEDTITDGAIVSVNSKVVSFDFGKNKKADISVGDKSAVSVDFAKLAADVATWLSTSNYTSVEGLMSSNDTANINEFLTAFTADSVTTTVA